MSWSQKPLEEVADFCLGKMLDQKKNRGEFMTYLANVNVRWGEFDFGNLREMRFESGELDRYGLKYGDIVMCEGGEPGRCAIWKNQVPGMMIQKALHRIRPHACLDSRFLFYSFLKKGRNDELSGLFTGSTIKHLPREKLAKVHIDVPPLSIQQRIASILSAYDDLIENNRRRIALLDEAARLLYREWFVHFRFPGHEHVKIVDGIPEGWTRRKLAELAEVVMGQSPKSKFYNDVGDGLPFHQGVTDYGFRFVYHRTYSTAVTKLAKAGDILVSVRAPVGRINITRDKIVLGRGLAAVRSRTERQSFLFYALKNHFYAENIIGTGAIYAATNKKELESQTLIEPPKNILAEFEEQVRDIDHIISNLTTQTKILDRARDLLLPRLMNGEIAV